MKSEYTVAIGRVARTVTINFDKLPEVSQEFIIAYGLKRNINDGLSQESMEAYLAMEGNADNTEANFHEYTMGLVDNKLAKLASGEVRSAASGPRSDGRVREVQAILRQNFGLSAKDAGVLKSMADVEAFCIKRSGKDAGPKLMEKVAAKADANIANRSLDDLPEAEV